MGKESQDEEHSSPKLEYASARSDTEGPSSLLDELVRAKRLGSSSSSNYLQPTASVASSSGDDGMKKMAPLNQSDTSVYDEMLDAKRLSSSRAVASTATASLQGGDAATSMSTPTPFTIDEEEEAIGEAVVSVASLSTSPSANHVMHYQQPDSIPIVAASFVREDNEDVETAQRKQEEAEEGKRAKAEPTKRSATTYCLFLLLVLAVLGLVVGVAVPLASRSRDASESTANIGATQTVAPSSTPPQTTSPPTSSPTSPVWMLVGNTTIFGEDVGYAIAVSGDGTTVASGDPSINDLQAKVDIFRVADNDLLERTARIDGQNPQDLTGSSVALGQSGSIVAVGAPGVYGSNDIGEVRLYELDNIDYQQVGTVFGVEDFFESGLFGRPISMSTDGSVLAVASQLYPVYLEGNNSTYVDASGRVQIYRRAPEGWVELGQVVGELGEKQFGEDIQLSSNGALMAVQTYSEIYGEVLTTNSTIKIFRIQDDLIEHVSTFARELPLISESLKFALSADASTIAIGQSSGNEKGIESGRVQVFRLEEEGGVWKQVGEDILGDGDFVSFGSEVAVNANGTVVVVASGGKDYLQAFQLVDDGSWSPLGDRIDGLAGDAVSVSGFFNSFYLDISDDGTVFVAGCSSCVTGVNWEPLNYVQVYRLTWVEG